MSNIKSDYRFRIDFCKRIALFWKTIHKSKAFAITAEVNAQINLLKLMTIIFVARDAKRFFRF